MNNVIRGRLPRLHPQRHQGKRRAFSDLDSLVCGDGCDGWGPAFGTL